jgi:ABC-2 type transport system permease protein
LQAPHPAPLIASDFESGFARRLLLAAPHRASVVAGYILGSVTLALVLMLFVTLVGVAVGVAVDGNLLEFAGLYGLAILLTVVSALWAAGFALRTRITRAQTSASMPIFLSLMLSPAFVPRPLLSSWLRVTASYNPHTAILESARGLISGEPDKTILAYLVALGLVAAFSLRTISGLRLALRSTWWHPIIRTEDAPEGPWERIPLTSQMVPPAGLELQLRRLQGNWLVQMLRTLTNVIV